MKRYINFLPLVICTISPKDASLFLVVVAVVIFCFFKKSLGGE